MKDLQRAHDNVVTNYPYLGTYARATRAMYSQNLRLVPISCLGFLFGDDMRKPSLKSGQLKRLGQGWLHVCGPVESLPGFRNRVAGTSSVVSFPMLRCFRFPSSIISPLEKYGWRLIFKDVASASNAMLHLDGRRSGVLPWYAVDYALDWTAFGGERPPSTSVHIHGTTLHTGSAEMPLKAFISLLHGVKHVDIRCVTFNAILAVF